MTQERLEKIKAIKSDIKAKTNGKSFKNLSTGEKDALLEAMAKMLGLL